MFLTLIERVYIRGGGGGGGGGDGRERNECRILSITLKTCDKEKLPLYQ